MNNSKNYLDSNDPAVTADDLAVSAVPFEADELTDADDDMGASSGIYEHVFKKPVPYNGTSITRLVFDWDLLTGQDSLSIENELQTLGKMVVAPAFSGEYLIRMAARASSPRVGADFFLSISLGEYNRIRSAARSFLLRSE